MRRLLVVVLLMVSVASASEESERVVVTTEGGKIAGIRELSTKGNVFYSFSSLPYAKPPIGNLRLKDPVAAGGWTGVRDGSVPPPKCPQLDFVPVTLRKPEYRGEEDCLYLNVHSPKPGDHGAELPVMVFIHGGAFFAGASTLYPPHVLLNENVVLVTLQYRLGVLGFLSMEDSVIPGNFGMKDQTMALRWVQSNIANFGGDPKRVTLFGESAGGASVNFHLFSPHSENLFARGIMQSGTLLSPWATGGAYREVAEHTGKLFSCPTPKATHHDTYSNILLDCLQHVDPKNLTLSLMDHIHFGFNPTLLGPRVDGDFLPFQPEVLLMQGKHKVADVISGINSHEGGLSAIPLYAMEQLQSDLLNDFPKFGPASLNILLDETQPVELARKIFTHYTGGINIGVEDADNVCKMFGDRHFIMGHDMTAISYSQNVSPYGSKTFLYELNHRGQRSFSDFYDTNVGRHWVNHVDELFYLFTGQNTPWQPLEREEDLRLREILTRLWTNFAATGNPTPDDSLGFTWEPANVDDLHHLSLTPTPTMEDDHRQEVREFWKSLPTKQNQILHPELSAVRNEL